LHLATGGQGEFDLDYVIVQNVIGVDHSATMNETVVEETSPAFSFMDGSWNITTSEDNSYAPSAYSGGSERTTQSVGAKVQLTFQGTGVVSLTHLFLQSWLI
jgi:formate-dependent phosphoribosylglycinamide formyltransferase (GAR transformylase)